METAKSQPTYRELQEMNAALQLEVFRLQQKLSRFQRLLFGQKRERFIPAENGQLAFDQRQLYFPIDDN